MSFKSVAVGVAAAFASLVITIPISVMIAERQQVAPPVPLDATPFGADVVVTHVAINLWPGFYISIVAFVVVFYLTHRHGSRT
jgi:fucose 4-O-acetylase-like acetyltransferase